MPVSERTYQAVVLDDPEGRWELFDGRLRGKPDMSVSHNRSMMRLGSQLMRQVDPDEYEVRINTGHVRSASRTYFIPDLFIVPVAALPPTNPTGPEPLEVLDAPMLFVAEVWSPSTGGYDVDAKFPEYRRRDDREIWRLHPYDHTVTIWRRRSEGSYVESVVSGGVIALLALPHVTVDIDDVFRFR